MTTTGMSKVKLKQNLIFGGIFYREGLVMERNEIPLSLRKNKFIGSPDAPETLRLAEEEVDQEVIYDDSMGMGETTMEEFEEQPKPKRFRG
jgi:hypothetical protein